MSALLAYEQNSKLPDQLHILSVDINQLRTQLEYLENDKRVEFISKDGILKLFDIYVQLKIMSHLLNSHFKKIVNRKNSNLVHYEYEKISARRKFRLPKNSQERSHLLKTNDYLRNYFQRLFIHFLSQSNGQMHESYLNSFFKATISGDYRKLELMLFPQLYEMIILKKDFITNKVGKPTDIKRVLLFDILSVMLTDRIFITQDRFQAYSAETDNEKLRYGGSYYRYKRDYVRNIIGK